MPVVSTTRILRLPGWWAGDGGPNVGLLGMSQISKKMIAPSSWKICRPLSQFEQGKDN